MTTNNATARAANVKLTVISLRATELGGQATETTVTYWRTPSDAIAWRKSYCQGAEVVSTELDWAE